MNRDQLTIEKETRNSSADKEKVEEEKQPFPTWPIVFFVLCMLLDNGIGKAFLDPILEPSVRVSATGWLISKPLGILGCFLLAYFVSKKKPKEVMFGEARVQNRLPFIDSLLLLIAFVSLIWLSVIFLYSPLSQIFIPIVPNLGFPSVRHETLTQLMVVIVGMGFLGPIEEELIFRGVLARHLQNYGNLFAILISALPFALLHSGPQFTYAFVTGLLCGILLIKTDNLLWAIGVHLLYNSSVFVFDWLAISYMDARFAQVCAAISAVCLILYGLHRHVSLKHFSLKIRVCGWKEYLKANKQTYLAAFSSPGMCLCYVLFILSFVAYIPVFR